MIRGRVTRNESKVAASLVGERYRPNGQTIEVGFFDSAPEYPDGKHPIEVAAHINYGTDRMKARPFMKLGLKRARLKIRAVYAFSRWPRLLRRGARARSQHALLAKVQAIMERETKNAIRRYPTGPIWQTGHLHDSVQSRRVK